LEGFFMAADFLTPPAVAELLGVSADKIIGWILAGELVAANLATTTVGRPRYRIARTDLDDFLRRRSAAVAPTPTPRRRKPAAARTYY
jgi:excisionase family DNA binding protein